MLNANVFKPKTAGGAAIEYSAGLVAKIIEKAVQENSKEIQDFAFSVKNAQTIFGLNDTEMRCAMAAAYRGADILNIKYVEFFFRAAGLLPQGKTVCEHCIGIGATAYWLPKVCKKCAGEGIV